MPARLQGRSGGARSVDGWFGVPVWDGLIDGNDLMSTRPEVVIQYDNILVVARAFGVWGDFVLGLRWWFWKISCSFFSLGWSLSLLMSWSCFRQGSRSMKVQRIRRPYVTCLAFIIGRLIPCTFLRRHLLWRFRALIIALDLISGLWRFKTFLCSVVLVDFCMVQTLGCFRYSVLRPTVGPFDYGSNIWGTPFWTLTLFSDLHQG